MLPRLPQIPLAKLPQITTTIYFEHRNKLSQILPHEGHSFRRPKGLLIKVPGDTTHRGYIPGGRGLSSRCRGNLLFQASHFDMHALSCVLSSLELYLSPSPLTARCGCPTLDLRLKTSPIVASPCWFE